MGELVREAVESHLRTLSPSAGGDVLRILRAALALAVDDGLVTRNVAKLVQPPKQVPRQGIALTGEQVQTLLRVTSEDDFHALWAVLFGSGVRLGEALGLRWPDVDTKAHTLTITGSMRHQDARTRGSGPRLQLQEPKTAAGRRTAPLAGFAARALDAMPRDAVYVFHRHNGKPLNPSTVQRAFADAVTRAELPKMRLHDARHTAATLMLGAGFNLNDVKQALGHASVSITADIYSHVVASRQRELADALDEAVG